MGYVLGVTLALLAGFVGLAIEEHKQNKTLTEALNWRLDQIEELEEEQKQLHADIKYLQANQKPVPWNKGKKGYKLPPRKSKLMLTEFVPHGFPHVLGTSGPKA